MPGLPARRVSLRLLRLLRRRLRMYLQRALGGEEMMTLGAGAALHPQQQRQIIQRVRVSRAVGLEETMTCSPTSGSREAGRRRFWVGGILEYLHRLRMEYMMDRKESHVYRTK